jgi:hypothetical protein
MKKVFLIFCVLMAGCQRPETLEFVSCVRAESETFYLRSDGIVVIVSPDGFVDKLPVFCVSQRIVDGFCDDLDGRKNRVIARSNKQRSTAPILGRG